MKFLTSTVLLSISTVVTADIFALHQAAQLAVRSAALIPRNPEISSHLERRQLSDDCVAACRPLTSLGTCTSSPDCDCPLLLATGSECATCIRSTNATLARQIDQLTQICQSGSLSASTSATRTSSRPSQVTGTPSAAACTSACGAIASAPPCINGGIDCICDIISREGPICAQCALVNENNATAANIILGAVDECVGLDSSVTGTSASLAPSCVSACSQFAAAETGCGETDPICVCSDILAVGPICSACLAPRNASAASLIGEGISLCRSVVGTTAAGGSTRTSSAGGIILTNVPSESKTGSTGAAITINGVQSSLARKGIDMRGLPALNLAVAGAFAVLLGWMAVLIH